jgi:hypothetical protein
MNDITSGAGPGHDLFWGLIREISQLWDNITHGRSRTRSRSVLGVDS